MTRILQLSVVALFALACGNVSPEPTTTANEPPSAPVELLSFDAGPSKPDTLVNLDASPIAAIAPAPDASPAMPDASPAMPDVALKPSKSWPFFAWDKAQAFTFNLRRPGPGARLRVYTGDQGWTAKPVAGPQLTPSQSKTALELLAKTQGQMIVSKCPFPRHGIVFFQHEVPVGSISVCFECGDIMIWPRYRQDPNWEDRKTKRFSKLIKAYDRVFPKWGELFESELRLPKDWQKLPAQTTP